MNCDTLTRVPPGKWVEPRMWETRARRAIWNAVNFHFTNSFFHKFHLQNYNLLLIYEVINSCLVCILYFNSGVCWIEWRVGICRRHRVLPHYHFLFSLYCHHDQNTFAFFMGCVFWKVWPKDLHIYVCLSVCWDAFLHLSKLSAQVYTYMSAQMSFKVSEAVSILSTSASSSFWSLFL